MFGIGARSIISDRLSAAQAVRAQAALSQAVGGAQRPREGRHRAPTRRGSPWGCRSTATPS